jgi:hypothetical protein
LFPAHGVAHLLFCTVSHNRAAQDTTEISDAGYRTSFITASPMTSGELLKYRNRLLIPRS